MRIFERYQGVKNSFNRIIHTLEVFKRAQDPMTFAEALKGKDIKYIEKIIDFGEDILLKGTSSDFTMKLNTKNSQNFFKNL